MQYQYSLHWFNCFTCYFILEFKKLVSSLCFFCLRKEVSFIFNICFESVNSQLYLFKKFITEQQFVEKLLTIDIDISTSHGCRIGWLPMTISPSCMCMCVLLLSAICLVSLTHFTLPDFMFKWSINDPLQAVIHRMHYMFKWSIISMFLQILAFIKGHS